MSYLKENNKLEYHNENGIWVDYINGTWLFLIKDNTWDSEEIRRVKKSDVTLSFVQKGISDLFLLEVFDCLETSDIPFCVKDGDDTLYKSLHETKSFKYEIGLIDKRDTIVAVREGVLNRDNSCILHDALCKRYDEEFTSEDADNSYAKLMMKFEPYELEPFALFTQKN